MAEVDGGGPNGGSTPPHSGHEVVDVHTSSFDTIFVSAFAPGVCPFGIRQFARWCSVLRRQLQDLLKSLHGCGTECGDVGMLRCWPLSGFTAKMPTMLGSGCRGLGLGAYLSSQVSQIERAIEVVGTRSRYDPVMQVRAGLK